MIDQRLWNTHIDLREQQFMRESENDRLASECQRIHHTLSPLALILRQAFAVFRARMPAPYAPYASYAGVQPGEARYHPTRDENKAALLAEAEDIVRLHWAEPSNKLAHTLSDCACDPC
jgi:hypothetical protein